MSKRNKSSNSDDKSATQGNSQSQDVPNDQSPVSDPATDEAVVHGLGASVELEQLHRKVSELTEALQHERADAMNIRRRHDEQLANLKSMLRVQVVEELLPVIDNFERALKHVPKDLENNDYVKGVQGVVKQFEQTLSGMGVTRIKTKGEVFNPHLHEAVGIDDGEGKQEIVSEELQAGYQLGDQVIRHAMVKVRRT